MHDYVCQMIIIKLLLNKAITYGCKYCRYMFFLLGDQQILQIIKNNIHSKCELKRLYTHDLIYFIARWFFMCSTLPECSTSKLLFHGR